jgi:prophage tail gpP-like protein
MADPKLRIRLPGSTGIPAVTVSAGQRASVGQYYSDILPAIEWCVFDDMLTVSDSMSFTVANSDGANAGVFLPGRRVEVDASDDGVNGGSWTRVFTGRVIDVTYGSDLAGGSTIVVSCMDLGWHLTSCCAPPLQTTNGIKLNQLVASLIDSTWGFQTTASSPTVTVGDVLNRRLKQNARTAAQRNQPRNREDVLPPIQVEPGQTPWAILEEYFRREGYLLNVGAMGDLVIFQPDYTPPGKYPSIEYHGSTEARRKMNNVEGRPSLRLSLNGLYSEFQVWSTIAVPNIKQQADIVQNPNASYLVDKYASNSNALPFFRRQVTVDSEAITHTMRINRAVFGFQMGQFESTTYECTVMGHSARPDKDSDAVFWVAGDMISVNDTINGPTTGAWYIQRVEKQWSLHGGAKTKLTLRLPRLDPQLQARFGGGAQRAKAGTK